MPYRAIRADRQHPALNAFEVLGPCFPYGLEQGFYASLRMSFWTVTARPGNRPAGGSNLTPSFHQKLCVQRTSCIDAFQDVDHVMWGNP